MNALFAYRVAAANSTEAFNKGLAIKSRDYEVWSGTQSLTKKSNRRGTVGKNE